MSDTEKFRPERPRKSKPGHAIAARRHDDDFLPSPKRYADLVQPGRYFAATTTVTKESYRGARDYLLVLFDLWGSPDAMSAGEEPVARGVPGFFNLAGGPSSRYARLLQLIFPDDQRARFSDLAGKFLEVDVVTVDTGGDERPLPAAFHYSKVSSVVTRA